MGRSNINEDLPLYSRDSRCPKCWCTETKLTEYSRLKGLMVRICGECGAPRYERPLDQAMPAEVA